MTIKYDIVFQELEDLQQAEPFNFLGENEKREIEEIEHLRQIVASLQDHSDFTYYSST
jgi:hypothetical protein